ncbi:hypothetical protein [Aminobacter niigataensis]|uniref:hypothetical protein n=1 Tax=Aminobacter niigataensis TaxID=83265 RepID=UPI0024CDD94B|nr:hypothetical protein [Aminobacter niigataensis]CAI2934747.1 conserved protein of unknown function [Aminobacter niigataensis]
MNGNRTSTVPVEIPRTNRIETARGITSLPAGKAVPIFACGLHRMDRIVQGPLRCSFELMETADVLMNAVRVDVKAYVVPMLAFERFNGSLDVLNRSWEGQVPYPTQAVVPFYETIPAPAYKFSDILVYLGMHSKVGSAVNSMFTEAYNEIFNFRLRNRSKALYASAARTRLQQNLAPAFWNHEMFAHIVPDYDSAKVDGIVNLSVANAKLPVKGIGLKSGFGWSAAGNTVVRGDGGTEVTVATAGQRWTSQSAAGENPMLKEDPNNIGSLAVFAELQSNGITVSLANIELAKKTQAFARLREQYAGHTDEWLVNMLMDGIDIPDQYLKEPMLVGEASTIFGFSKRYATDAANLTEHVANGATFVDLNIRVPVLNTGGVLMIIAEITPEQLFERQKNPWLHLDNNKLNRPDFVRDSMDPDKVDIVTNDRIDLDHSAPSARFGYEPMGARWNNKIPHIGGKFFRPVANAAFDEDRQRFWAAEALNPTLGPEFYLATTIHTKPFADTVSDIAEVVIQGDLLINGNTQFGAGLIEASDDYAKVLAEVDQTRAKPA